MTSTRVQTLEDLNPGSSPAFLNLGRRRWRMTIVAVLLVLFAAQAILSLIGDSATFDETAHVASGFTQLDRGDYRLNLMHPPLAPMICMAPATLLELPNVDYGDLAWRNSVQYKLGFEILSGPAENDLRENPTGLLILCRLPMVGLGVLLGLIVYAWSTELWGTTEAMAALFLYSFSPTMLAHTRLITMDLPACFGFTATLWTLWRFCLRPGWIRSVLFGASLGVALLMKHSMLTLIPIVGFLLIHWVVSGGSAWRTRLTAAAGVLFVAAILSANLIWFTYRYRYAATLDPKVRLDWNLPSMTGTTSTLINLARGQRILPEGYLYGVAFQLVRSSHQVFLNGQVSDEGWWYYLPEAFLLKTTPSLLILTGAVIVAAVRRVKGLTFNGWFLAIPCIYLFFMTASRGVNIGHRYLAPIYPALCIASGLSVRAIGNVRWKGIAVALILAGQPMSALTSFPGYLSYFNVLAGGSEKGWRYLVDSNIDWGQDLPRLKKWMDRNHVALIHLAYFGTADPAAYGIRGPRMQVLDWKTPDRFESPKPGDHVAVSVTLLQGLFVRDDIAGYLRQLRTLHPVGKAGDSIFVFRVVD